MTHEADQPQSKELPLPIHGVYILMEPNLASDYPETESKRLIGLDQYSTTDLKDLLQPTEYGARAARMDTQGRLLTEDTKTTYFDAKTLITREQAAASLAAGTLDLDGMGPLESQIFDDDVIAIIRTRTGRAVLMRAGDKIIESKTTNPQT